ncbi:hypothetical protein KO493_12475 [Tamlana agarivorans]|uniref:Uncharacterized protein n=1 Tax=Pseudotamlana agarivorans TaxID=481183 RepID=A0ACC5UB06_9FLAO|nr:hypothetical protein [Tamlana agarivorans]
MSNRKPYKIALITIWIIYILYEVYLNFIWAANEIGAIIRVDLFILWPFLLIITIFLLYKIFKKKK